LLTFKYQTKLSFFQIKNKNKNEFSSSALIHCGYKYVKLICQTKQFDEESKIKTKLKILVSRFIWQDFRNIDVCALYVNFT